MKINQESVLSNGEKAKEFIYKCPLKTIFAKSNKKFVKQKSLIIIKHYGEMPQMEYARFESMILRLESFLRKVLTDVCCNCITCGFPMWQVETKCKNCGTSHNSLKITEKISMTKL